MKESDVVGSQPVAAMPIVEAGWEAQNHLFMRSVLLITPIELSP